MIDGWIATYFVLVLATNLTDVTVLNVERWDTWIGVMKLIFFVLDLQFYFNEFKSA